MARHSFFKKKKKYSFVRLKLLRSAIIRALNKRRKFDTFVQRHSVTDFDGLRGEFPKLFVKTTFTNIKLTLTDSSNKVIACHSSGSLASQVLVDVKKPLKLLALSLES